MCESGDNQDNDAATDDSEARTTLKEGGDTTEDVTIGDDPGAAVSQVWELSVNLVCLP